MPSSALQEIYFRVNEASMFRARFIIPLRVHQHKVVGDVRRPSARTTSAGLPGKLIGHVADIPFRRTARMKADC